MLADGLPWTWESFPEYLDTLAEREADVDFGAQVPHAPVRIVRHGRARRRRASRRRPPTSPRWRRSSATASRAGALGFSTSRTLMHRTKGGRLTPSATAAEEELRGITRALGELGRGVVQMIDDFGDTVPERSTEFEMWERIVAESGRPLSFNLTQRPGLRDNFRFLLALLSRAGDAGLPIRAQVCSRPIGLLFGLELSYNPFSACPSYARIASLPLARARAADAATRGARGDPRGSRPTVRAPWPRPTRSRPISSRASTSWAIRRTTRRVPRRASVHGRRRAASPRTSSPTMRCWSTTARRSCICRPRTT